MRHRGQAALLAITAALAGHGCAKGLNDPGDDAGSTASGSGGQGGAPATSTGEGGAISVGQGGGAVTGAGGGSATCTMAGETQPCYGGQPAEAGIGACALGTQTCEASGEFLGWGDCKGWIGPSPEKCDGFDNDCDGIIDDGAGCMSGGCAGPADPCVELPIPPAMPLGSTCKQAFPPAATLPCPIPNPGTQYYVSSANGDDLNPGTSPNKPFATLCHAVAAAPPGSTLQVAEGDYASASVYVGKELVVKGGYDAAFASWDPDKHPSNFHGRLTLDHDAAVWGGFRMLGRPQGQPNVAHEMFHRIAAGTLLRNYVELVFSGSADSVFFYGIVASACSGGTSRLACNDIYVRADGPMVWSLDAIEYGNMASHLGSSILDSNHICFDDSSSSHVQTVIGGYGTCPPAVNPASVVMTNNVIESAYKGFVSQAMEFYGCGNVDLSLVLTNNTILSMKDGIAGYEGPPSQLRWKLTNNVIAGLGNTGDAVQVGSGAVQISSSEANLAFGFGANDISPAPLMSMGDDTSGADTLSSVFSGAAAGDFTLKAGGQGAGTGVNVFGLQPYGAVTTDIVQKPRPLAGPWDRGAYKF